MNGFIKLHRRICKWEWYHDPNTFRLFIHLLLNANHEMNRWQGKEVKRGQIITGLKSIKRDLGLSIQETRTSLTKLKSTGEITVKATNKYSLVTLINYDIYQGRDDLPTRKTTRHATNEQQTINNKQEVKEVEEVNNKDIRENVVSTKGVPIQEIVKKWNEFAVDHQLPQTVKTTAKISGQIRQRWKDDLPAMENWENYFDYISKSNFLVGKTTPGNGRNKPFRATLEWITRESNFAKIAAEEYH